jgi:D-aminoacyl-tRNA deacylase
MKAIIQRVTNACVTINSSEKRGIGKGFVVFVGIGADDTSETCRVLADKIVNLRIFPNDEGKFSRSLLDVGGELLVISQFTLYADCSRGRRPDFSKAARPEKAVPLYEEFIKCLRGTQLKVVTGEFAADMLVNINNDGPVTIVIDTDEDARH